MQRSYTAPTKAPHFCAVALCSRVTELTRSIRGSRNASRSAQPAVSVRLGVRPIRCQADGHLLLERDTRRELSLRASLTLSSADLRVNCAIVEHGHGMGERGRNKRTSCGVPTKKIETLRHVRLFEASTGSTLGTRKTPTTSLRFARSPNYAAGVILCRQS
jgi:hypothetical protein